MTARDISSLYYIKKEIAQIKKEIQALESSRIYGKAITYSDMPKGNAPDATEKIDRYLDKMQELKDMLHYAMRTLQTERIKIESFIDGIEDPEIRLIMRLRGIDNLSWTEIGEMLGKHRTSVSKKFYNFFKVSHNSH